MGRQLVRLSADRDIYRGRPQALHAGTADTDDPDAIRPIGQRSCRREAQGRDVLLIPSGHAGVAIADKHFVLRRTEQRVPGKRGSSVKR